MILFIHLLNRDEKNKATDLVQPQIHATVYKVMDDKTEENKLQEIVEEYKFFYIYCKFFIFVMDVILRKI